MNTTTTLARLLVGTAVATFALAGCASGTESSAPGASGAASDSTPSVATRGEFTDADVAFAQGMIPHHRQAVEMAELCAGRTETPEALDLAARIGGAQEPEIATMTTWLQEWGAEVPAEDDAMGGMDHSGMGGTAGMGGMMTPEQMTALGQASGAEFDRMFLQMMVEHHRGAVEMAQSELADGTNPEALALAQEIADAQQAEISEMESLLQQA